MTDPTTTSRRLDRREWDTAKRLVAAAISAPADLVAEVDRLDLREGTSASIAQCFIAELFGRRCLTYHERRPTAGGAPSRSEFLAEVGRLGFLDVVDRDLFAELVDIAYAQGARPKHEIRDRQLVTYVSFETVALLLASVGRRGGWKSRFGVLKAALRARGFQILDDAALTALRARKHARESGEGP